MEGRGGGQSNMRRIDIGTASVRVRGILDKNISLWRTRVFMRGAVTSVLAMP